MSDSVAEPLELLLADPARVTEMSSEQAAALLGRLATLVPLLAARVASATVAPAKPVPVATADRFLTPCEAAERLGVTVRWLYRHADQLPFTRRLLPRTLRFSEAGMVREMGPKNALNKARSYA